MPFGPAMPTLQSFDSACAFSPDEGRLYVIDNMQIV